MTAPTPMGSNADSPRPRLIQASSSPIARGGGSDTLQCVSCKGVLAEFYPARCLVAIDVQCNACGFVTRSASWPDDEPLPAPISSLGKSGDILVKNPIDFSDGRVLTCDAEIERVARVSGCRPSVRSRIELNLDGLRVLEQQLASLTSGAFLSALASAERAFAAGNHQFMKCPPAWAIAHLRRLMVGGDLEIASGDGMALSYLSVLQHVIERWQHHPMFSSIAKGLVNEFHHTITMLVAASAMSDMGNRIGFTQTASASGRSPDMYVSVDYNNRISIEVKAPIELQWPRPPITSDRITALVTKRAKDAANQFGQSGSGLLVLGASDLHADSQNDFELAIKTALAQKKISSRIAAIASVHLSGLPRIKHIGLDSLATTSSFTLFIEENPFYTGPTFLETMPEISID